MAIKGFVKVKVPSGIVDITKFDSVFGSVVFTYNGVSVTYGVVESLTGRYWLDRNIGADNVATSSDDSGSFGHWFQWGRLDDGHQLLTAPTTTITSSEDVPGNDSFYTTPNTSEYEPHDWRSPQNDNLWQGAGGINLVGPTGWRVPTSAEWEAEMATWSSSGTPSQRAFNSVLKLPHGKYKTVGSSYTYYWSSTVVGNYANALTIRDVNPHPQIDTIYRKWGCSLRLIKN